MKTARPFRFRTLTRGVGFSRHHALRIIQAFAIGSLALTAQAQTQPTASAIRTIQDKVTSAHPLPLNSIRLTAGPLKAAQAADAPFILTIDPDRALSALRTAAGLQPQAQPLGGWDSAGNHFLTGHIAGHLLSALSFMYAATGDDQFKQRADYMVTELAAIQNKQGDGFIGAQKDRNGTSSKELFQQIAAGNLSSPRGEDLMGLWSPWYVEHKLFAGLRDAYRHTGNKQALEVEKKFAAWVDTTLANLNDDQIQKMLQAEFGGMNEVLADLYADTADPRWLALSYKFEHRAFTQPLAQQKDQLGGQHANHNIPTIVGSAARYAYTGKPEDLATADFFWKAVVNHHSFATAGNSGDIDGEFFPQPDQLAAMIKRTPDAAINESCNIYNMLKLTRRLFSFQPNAQYADYMERALFNHSLAQIDPSNGQMSYHIPVGQHVQHDYQSGGPRNINSQFTCCVGTGMENPALYGDGIYYQANDKLWINLYTPSTAQWPEAGATLTMETDLPEGESAKLTLTLKTPKKLTLALRRPAWTTNSFAIKINGQPFAIVASNPTDANPSTFIDLKRTWKSGDTIELTIPKSLHLEPTPDDPTMVAILWGPLVLGQDIGPAQATRRAARNANAPTQGNPALVTSSQTVSDWLKPIPNQPGQFRTNGVARLPTSPTDPIDINFLPLYRLHNRIYSVYMNLYTPEAWAKRTNAP